MISLAIGECGSTCLTAPFQTRTWALVGYVLLDLPRDGLDFAVAASAVIVPAALIFAVIGVGRAQ